ncbi:MAG: FtsW/RodA/SpoVE family cell cycle protein [Clostridia bacterium]|nr:FtsW/RodA/SpoVE family cell cycle protein [Clostridia bacterium]
MSNENLNKRFNWGLMMTIITAFQALTSTVVIVKDGVNLKLLAVFAAYIAAEWLYFFIASNFCGQNNFELEIIGFLFSGIGLTVCASVYDDYALKQMVSILIGLFVFIFLLIILRRTDIVMNLRMPIAFAAVGLLCLNLVLAEYNNGALNWITIAGFSIQPSEIVKLAFIFVGAASLDKLQSTKSLTKYLIFSFGCVGALFLMRDFGTALIFFFTFIIIAFMRSGDVRTIALVCVAAALGAIMIIYFRPTVAARFSTYRHIWEHINDAGMQQTRVLIYSASGGLFGLGIGNGKLKDIFASTTDLIFGMLCEEWGMIVAFIIVLTYVFILFYAIKVARSTRSAFYAIAACAAAGLMLFQTALNIFGVTDILPLTGVTLPFISRGGSSMICSWGLLAFIKAADIRTYPKLSKTILPDHPLYPPDIKIGKRAPRQTRRPVSVPRVVGDPINQKPASQQTARKTTQSKPAQTKSYARSTAKDIPVSRQQAARKKTTATTSSRAASTRSGSTAKRTSSAKDVPVSRKTSSNGRAKR